MKLRMNEFGLYRTEDGKWGVRQIGERLWVVQYRENVEDVWGWEIVGRVYSFDEAARFIVEHQVA